MQTVMTSHIYLDEKGRAWIDDTNTKVIEVILDKLAYDWSVEEIHEQHPHLSLAQIHAALSYYYDHQAELDLQIERQDKEIEALMEKAKDSPLKQRLRSLPQKIHERAIVDENRQSFFDDLKARYTHSINACMKANNCDERRAIEIIFYNGAQLSKGSGYKPLDEAAELKEKRRA